MKSCYGQDANRAGYHPALVKLCRITFFQSTWQRKYLLFENSQTASRAAQKTLAGRVFETPGINRVMSPSDAVDLESPCNSLFEFQSDYRDFDSE